MENCQQNFPPPQREVSISNWIVTFILVWIPFVNIIMLIVWALGGTEPVSKANFAKATLIMMAIGIALCFIFSSFIGSLLGPTFTGIF